MRRLNLMNHNLHNPSVDAMIAKPNHIALIMDGNNRWATFHGLSSKDGHKAGLKAVRAAIRSAAKLNISVLTLFAFSTENWNRPEQEVGAIMNLFKFALTEDVHKMISNNIRLRVIGEKQALSKDLQELIAIAERKTKHNTGLQLNVAVNYGGRWDILSAAKKMAHTLVENQRSIDEVTESDFSRHLSLSDLPDVDLCIRTSGEQRISNFLLWQLAYAEFIFLDINWPDFKQNEMTKALIEYSKRQRNFGQRSQKLQVV